MCFSDVHDLFTLVKNCDFVCLNCVWNAPQCTASCCTVGAKCEFLLSILTHGRRPSHNAPCGWLTFGGGPSLNVHIVQWETTNLRIPLARSLTHFKPWSFYFQLIHSSNRMNGTRYFNRTNRTLQKCWQWNSRFWKVGRLRVTSVLNLWGCCWRWVRWRRWWQPWLARSAYVHTHQIPSYYTLCVCVLCVIVYVAVHNCVCGCLCVCLCMCVCGCLCASVYM